MTDDYYREGLKKECQKVFEELFHFFYADLCAYAMRFLPDEEDAKEIVQGCFVKIWENRMNADKINSFRFYLYKSVYNCILNYFKHKEHQNKYASHETYLLKQSYAINFEDTYCSEIHDKIRLEIEKLPPKNKDIFKLRYFDGYNTKEVSKILGITPRSVEAYISRSIKMLKNKFNTVEALTNIFLCLCMATHYYYMLNY
ncbi:MAG: RNA polymerase sigma-70 factor [Bacteroidales bacterium]|nr:RNA polymerase sigma-70 factor [Bacteroidales bacterium]